jgi:arsenite methyltransferase
MISQASVSAADYGIDAPPVVRNLALSGVGALVIGFGLNFWLASSYPLVATIFLNWGIWAGAALLLSAAYMIWSSKVGKLRARDRLLDSLHLRGDEMVLDVGCGRGLLLNGAAKRLTTGKAVGIDLWQSEDQSGNRMEMALANAQAEGVADRVEVKTGDMRQMPFPDAQFDVVVASLAIHNIYDKAGRAQAIKEIARVLKPGGHVALLDIQRTEEYAQILRSLGWVDAARSGLSFLIFPAMRVVTGTKPG